MTSLRYCNRPIILGLAFSLCAVSASAQVPPPETNAFTLVDVGRVSVPAACPCITNPFTVPTIRPGWGYPSGPAAPVGNAVPSAAARRQAQRDAEDRATLAAVAEDGLAGNPHASASTAMHFTAGTAIPRNDEEAARWWYLAATQGHPDAYLQLGYRYHRGLGVRRNDKTAAYWFHTGASAGDRNAMVALGLLYAAGRGVPQDWSAAVAWWQQARSSPGGSPLASRFLGDAYVCGLGIAQSYEEAVLAYKEWVDKGDVSSSVQLGHMYASGCAPPNDEAAVAAYRVAADQGDPEAQVSLSGLVREGRGVQQDAFEAYFWARLAERRLPPGRLRERAEAQAKQAARLMSAAHVKDTDAFVDSVIAEGTKPMR
jgi:TPR repeat protein